MKEQLISSPEISEEEKKLNELKLRHPDNGLFKDSFGKNVPANYFSVFHYTTEDRIDKIDKHGLKPLLKAFSKDEWKEKIKSERVIPFWLRQMFKLEKTFAEVGKTMGYDGYNRAKEVIHAFAQDNDHFAKRMNKGDIVLEVKINPDKAVLVNTLIWEFAFERIEEDIQGLGLTENEVQAIREEYGKRYWESAVKYSDYEKLNSKQKEEMEIYEVLVSCGKEGINPDFIRINRAGV